MKTRFFFLCAALSVARAGMPVDAPVDASEFYGEPLRGAEPKQQPKWVPELKPITEEDVNQGNPLTDKGHFRLKKEIIGFPWKTMPYIPKLTEEAADRAAARYGDFEWKDGSRLKYSVLEPDPALQPEGGFPLVVICPGVGAIGRDSVKGRTRNVDPEVYWATEWYRKHLPAVVLVMHPQGRTHTYHDDPDGPPAMNTTPVLDAMDALIQETMKRPDLNPRRVVVTGFSMGGSSTWQLILRRPFFYAGAAPIAGRPLLRPEEAERVKPVPIWMAIGNQDTWSGSLLYLKCWQNLQDAGHPNARFWEVQDRGHDIDIGNTLPMAKWLWEQEREALP
jgi:predicted esterase